MENEKDNKGFNKEVETTITSQEAILDIDGETVSKIIWETGKGRITWKPKIVKTEYRGAIQVKAQIKPYIGDLPQKVVEIAQQLKEKGIVKARISYNYWETEKDGEPVTYRFLNSEKTINDWVIMKD